MELINKNICEMALNLLNEFDGKCTKTEIVNTVSKNLKVGTGKVWYVIKKYKTLKELDKNKGLNPIKLSDRFDISLEKTYDLKIKISKFQTEDYTGKCIYIHPDHNFFAFKNKFKKFTVNRCNLLFNEITIREVV
jgi:hypothetical protein